MKHARWLVLVAAAVSIGLLLSHFLTRGGSGDAASVQLSPVQPPQAAYASPRILAVMPLSPTSPAPSAAMRARFETAANYAAFIHDAMQRPSEGGRFYALMAFEKCREVAALSAAPVLQGRPDAVLAARKTIADLTQRCRGVMEQFPSEHLFTEALLYSNARSPDALLIERGTLRPATKEASESDIARALATQDPYFIAATMDANLDFVTDRLGPEFRNGEEQALLYQAMAVAGCEIAGNCKGHYRLALFCAAGEPCVHTDLAAYVKQGVPAESQELYERTLGRILQLARGRTADQPGQ
ncbi:hypothetical protein [Pseudoduganella rhizocola]|uniref:hypothetical protein n=1 Tax=Pseudoduganella rhizocola TaxID=3382643 RepID=UPI0038B4E15D